MLLREARSKFQVGTPASRLRLSVVKSGHPNLFLTRVRLKSFALPVNLFAIWTRRKADGIALREFPRIGNLRHTNFQELENMKRKTWDAGFNGAAVCAVITVALALPAAGATKTWNSGGAGGAWSVAANWGGTALTNGDALVFGSGARTVTTNDVAANASFAESRVAAGAR